MSGRMRDPARGQELIILSHTPELLVLQATYAPGSKPPPAHLHPEQSERFTVESGTMRVVLGGVARLLETGEVLEIPPGTPHQMSNAGQEEARLRWETRPALGTAGFLAALVRPERVAPGRQIQLLKQYQREFQLVHPPRWVQRLVFALCR